MKGECTLEGSGTTGESGRRLKIENAIYSMYDKNIRKGIVGFRDVTNDGLDTVPRLALGAFGIDQAESDVGNRHSYFVITPYPENNNPGHNPSPYVDIAYFSSTIGHWSNIKMFDDGEIKLAPLKALRISTNYLNGQYVDGNERDLALFASSGTDVYDGNLQIPAVRNMTNNYGLILADDHHDEAKCAVRVNVDSNGTRFFRPVRDVANIELGSGGYKWKKVHSANGVAYSVNDIDTTKSLTYMDEDIDSVLDSLDFDMNIHREMSNSSSDIQLNLNISKLKNHPLSSMFLDVIEEIHDDTNEIKTHTSADMTSLLHLALYELQKCKSEISSLKEEIKNLKIN